jgi:hypothetical protein
LLLLEPVNLLERRNVRKILWATRGTLVLQEFDEPYHVAA